MAKLHLTSLNSLEKAHTTGSKDLSSCSPAEFQRSVPEALLTTYLPGTFANDDVDRVGHESCASLAIVLTGQGDALADNLWDRAIPVIVLMADDVFGPSMTDTAAPEIAARAVLTTLPLSKKIGDGDGDPLVLLHADTRITSKTTQPRSRLGKYFPATWLIRFLGVVQSDGAGADSGVRQNRRRR